MTILASNHSSMMGDNTSLLISKGVIAGITDVLELLLLTVLLVPKVLPFFLLLAVLKASITD